MSAVRTDPSGNTIRELIESCRATHEGFRSAAQTVASSSLKQLFGLYAQQRSRFAEELSDWARAALAAAQRAALRKRPKARKAAKPKVLSKVAGKLAAGRKPAAKRPAPKRKPAKRKAKA